MSLFKSFSTCVRYIIRIWLLASCHLTPMKTLCTPQEHSATEPDPAQNRTFSTLSTVFTHFHPSWDVSFYATLQTVKKTVGRSTLMICSIAGRLLLNWGFWGTFFIHKCARRNYKTVHCSTVKIVQANVILFCRCEISTCTLAEKS